MTPPLREEFRGFTWPTLVWFVVHGLPVAIIAGWWKPLAWAARLLADAIESAGEAWERGVTLASGATMSVWPLRLIRDRIQREWDAEEKRRSMKWKVEFMRRRQATR